jgi:hypothetical protein
LTVKQLPLALNIILPVGEIFGLFSRADKLNYGEELLVTIELFLLFQYKPKKEFKMK